MSTQASQSSQINFSTPLLPMTSRSNRIDNAKFDMAEPKYLAQVVKLSGIDTDIPAAYEAAQKRWHTSRCQKKLLSRLRSSAPKSGWQISKAVCMALGTLNNHLSLQQLVVFMDMVHFLEKEGSCKSIELFAQDPRFTNTDKDFLRSLNIAILEAPNAERTIRRGVFSFVPLWVPEYQLVGRLSALQPSLHVGKFPYRIRNDCGWHSQKVMEKLEPIEQTRGLTAYESSVADQAILQFEKVKAFPDEFIEFSAHSCPLPFVKSFRGLQQLSVYVEKDHDLTEMPEEVTDADLFDIEEDTETCACCRPPTVVSSPME